MAYLIINAGISPARRKWLDANAVPIVKDVWLHNAVIDGALCARVEDITLSDLQRPIETSARKILSDAEERIIRGGLNGRAATLLTNRLRMVVDLSLDIDTIAHASDLLFAIGKTSTPGEVPQETASPKANPLGFDRDIVKKYLLSVAKKEPIH